MSQRQKGHNLERLVARLFSQMGFPARTTRAASNLLDSCGVDIVGTPFLIQCKAGYARARPKFEEEYDYIKTRLTKEFGETHAIIQYPVILVHQIDGKQGRVRKPQETYISMTLEDFTRLVAMRDPADYQIINVL